MSGPWFRRFSLLALMAVAGGIPVRASRSKLSLPMGVSPRRSDVSSPSHV
jgi:hypothetical protein